MYEPRNLYPEGSNIRKVIDYATVKFLANGVKQVTMDDIAHGLQMSKRTLYQLFADKEQLVVACVKLVGERERQLIHTMISDGYGTLEVVLRVIENRIKQFRGISSQFFDDVARYASIKNKIICAHEESLTRVAEFFERGIHEGYFRSDVNFKLLLTCIFEQINIRPSSSLLQHYSAQECFINIGIFHLRGCCTPKGIELVDKFLEFYRQEQANS